MDQMSGRENEPYRQEQSSGPGGNRSDEFHQFTYRVTRGDDGIYRWYYDMDMYRNKSMLYTLLKVNLMIFLSVTLFGSLFLGWMKGFDDPMVRGVALIGLAMIPAMSVLYILGYYIAAGIKQGDYRIHFEMNDDGIEIVWPSQLYEGLETGRKVMSLVGSVMGSRSVRGRWRPTLDEVSKMTFSSVLRYKSHSQWDMIDMSMLGGKFQVYATAKDFPFVESYILERIPGRARRVRR